MHEGKEKEICVTIHTIKFAKEAVDIALRQANMEKNHRFKYVSFSNSSTADGGGGLRLNKLLNTRLKHESLDDVSVLKQAKCNGKYMIVSEVIMSVTKMVLNYFKELSKDFENLNKMHAK